MSTTHTLIPPFLKEGDTIAIAATARFVTPEQIQAAVMLIEKQGFKVYLHPQLFDSDRQFGGTDSNRALYFNELLKNKDIKAIWCARGGYGTVRMIDGIDFDLLQNNPKWIIGFSDVTLLLNHVYFNLNMAVLHATMPIFMFDKSADELQQAELSFIQTIHYLKGNQLQYDFGSHEKINDHDFEGTVIGGNLSILLSALGSGSDGSWHDKILFIEDLDEYLYHIDRLLFTLKRAGKFDGLKGVLVGSFTQMKDHQIPFGYSVKEMILQQVSNNCPVIFGVNSGHVPLNLPIPFGIDVKYQNGLITFASA
jgi:muramoyltetrapeptide carboxypeptidase